jgi:hypothetical protein
VEDGKKKKKKKEKKWIDSKEEWAKRIEALDPAKRSQYEEGGEDNTRPFWSYNDGGTVNQHDVQTAVMVIENQARLAQ